MSQAKLLNSKPQNTSSKPGYSVRRYFTKPGRHPYEDVEWEIRTHKTAGPSGKQVDVKGEFPSFWSLNASGIAGAKYFRGHGEAREHSIRQIIDRVVKTIRVWGQNSGYFRSAREAETFEDELTHLLLFQKAAFNSPVWFNVGVKEKPQCSACFILNAEDNMESIMEWIRTEAMIFKGGSGAGVNLSKLRSSKEPLSQGGYSSGPVSFMRGADSVAGMIASGGATRRAAKMVLLDAEHPDIIDFIRCKAEEEKKVRALIGAGYNMADINEPAWRSIQYQNANNSVRLSDEFFKAVENDGDWKTRYVVSGKEADTYRARDLMREIAQAAWECADPGIHYKDTISRWHTCPNTGPIEGCNPCSEYMHLNNSACNLASINLIKFLNDDGTFKVKDFIQAVDVVILAQDILVGHSSYPTEKIEKTAHDYRQLGLGFANIGGLLTTLGIPYDSEEGRAWAGSITALMCGEAYRFSALIAGKMGPYAGFELNRAPQLNVIEMHRKEVENIKKEHLSDEKLYSAAKDAWDEAANLSKDYGVRNSQVTVIAPTGTIALMMDCATTGIEPLFAPVIYKQLVGGGMMKFAAETIPAGLKRLGYSQEQSGDIVAWVEENGRVEGAPHLKDEHLAVFDCAVTPAGGTRSIAWQGHVKMVASVQPFISGAISKTFNMPASTPVEEITDALMMGWKMGLKAFAVYRDGCKAAQPLSSGKKEDKKTKDVGTGHGPSQRKLPPVRSSETHKFVIAGHKGFLTYSAYNDGTLAEIFIRMAKQGSTLAGLLDAFAISISMALQHHVPLQTLCRKFIYGRYEPMGFTENPDVQVATSITDYIFRYLALRFLPDSDLASFGMNGKNGGHLEDIISKDFIKPEKDTSSQAVRTASAGAMPSAAPSVVYAETVCRICGGMMIRTGTCLTCTQCGEASGGC